MPEGTSTNSSPDAQLPVAMRGPALPVVGEWLDRGLCIGEDPDTFFPVNGAPGRKARGICGSCAVRLECLDYAVQADEFGIWGGYDQDERRNLKRRQRRQSAAALSGPGSRENGAGAA